MRAVWITVTMRSSVFGIPKDFSLQTCVFVGSEMWPRSLAENVTVMVTGTVCMGILYVLNKRQESRPGPTACCIVLTTKRFVEFSLNSARVVEQSRVSWKATQWQSYSIYGRKWVSTPTFQIYVPVWAQLHTYQIHLNSVTSLHFIFRLKPPIDGRK